MYLRFWFNANECAARNEWTCRFTGKIEPKTRKWTDWKRLKEIGKHTEYSTAHSQFRLCFKGGRGLRRFERIQKWKCEFTWARTRAREKNKQNKKEDSIPWKIHSEWGKRTNIKNKISLEIPNNGESLAKRMNYLKHTICGNCATAGKHKNMGMVNMRHGYAFELNDHFTWFHLILIVCENKCSRTQNNRKKNGGAERKKAAPFTILSFVSLMFSRC